MRHRLILISIILIASFEVAADEKVKDDIVLVTEAPLGKFLLNEALFKDSIGRGLIVLADEKPGAFAGELKVGKESLEMASHDLVVMIKMKHAWLELAGAKGTVNVNFQSIGHGPMIDSSPTKLGSMVKQGVTLAMIQEKAGVAPEKKTVIWYPQEPVTYDMYFDGAIGFTESNVYIDGPRFLKGLAAGKTTLTVQGKGRTLFADNGTTSEAQKPAPTEKAAASPDSHLTQSLPAEPAPTEKAAASPVENGPKPDATPRDELRLPPLKDLMAAIEKMGFEIARYGFAYSSNVGPTISRFSCTNKKEEIEFELSYTGKGKAVRLEADSEKAVGAVVRLAKDISPSLAEACETCIAEATKTKKPAKKQVGKVQIDAGTAMLSIETVPGLWDWLK